MDIFPSMLCGGPRMHGSRGDDGTHWQHRRSNWPRKMEDTSIDFYSEDWFDRASDRDSWRKSSGNFMAWAARRWGGPEPPPPRKPQAKEKQTTKKRERDPQEEATGS